MVLSVLGLWVFLGLIRVLKGFVVKGSETGKLFDRKTPDTEWRHS